MQAPRNVCLSAQVDLPAESNQQQHSALLEAIIKQAPQARCLTSLAIRQLLPLPPGAGHTANEVPPPLPPTAPPPVLSLGAACRLVSALPELRHLELPGTLEGGLPGVERLLRSAPVSGRLETLIVGDLWKDRTTRLSLEGGMGEDEEASEYAAAADAGEASGGPFGGVRGQGTRLVLSRCDLARAVTLLGGNDGAALRCLARLGLHLTLQPDPQRTHCFYVGGIDPRVDGAATAVGAGGAAAGVAAAEGQLQPAYDGGSSAVLLDRLAAIRLGGAGLISLLPADTLSVGFLTRLPPGSLGAGKAAAEVLKALGATGLRCRRLLLDVGGDAQHDGHFFHDAAAAATAHLTSMVCTCWKHLVSWGNLTSATAKLLTTFTLATQGSLAAMLKARGEDMAHFSGFDLLRPFTCIGARVEANALYNLSDQVRVPSRIIG